MGRDLLSKITAGGLSAGIFLLWWPLHLPSDGLAWLILRGVLWTLAVEALLLAFVPLERMLLRGLATQRLAGIRARVLSAPPRLRVCASVFLALAGFAAPMSLLAEVAEDPATLAAERPRVIRQVIVERPVIERRVVVREAPAVEAAPVESTAAPGTRTYLPARSLPTAPPSPAPAESRQREARAPTRDRVSEREAPPERDSPVPAASAPSAGAGSEAPGTAGGVPEAPAAGASSAGGEIVLAGTAGGGTAASAPAPA